MISLVTVSHRSHRHLPAYVDSFLASVAGRAIAPVEFVVVENSGAPGTDRLLDPLRAAGYRVTFVESPNHGFGAGCNLGAAYATGATLIFANPDIVFVDPLDPIDAAQEGSVWGTVAQDDANGASYAFDVLPEYKTVLGELLRRYRHVLPTGDNARRVYPVGSFFVVAAALFRKVGGFDERFFMYHEEAELARRLHKVAPPPTFFADIHVTHEAFGSAVTKDAVFRQETAGLLTYARVTGERRVIATRLLTQLLLAPLSASARRRLALLIKGATATGSTGGR
jgi:GT2 family glycosyltransferase